MRPNRKLALVALLVLGFSTLHAATSDAQRHFAGRRIIVGGYFGYPFYSPYYFYNPFFYGAYYPWGPYYLQGYPPPWMDRDDRDRTVGVKTEITPKDTQIYVDGYFSGTASDFDGLFKRLRLAPGQHEVVLYLKGYRTIRQTINLRGNSDVRIKEKMVPLAAGEASEAPPTPPPAPPPSVRERGDQPAPPDEAGAVRRPRLPRSRRDAPPAEARGFGSVAIRVQPDGADILIDGEPWHGPEGVGPLVVQLAAGPHRVEITKDGYVGYSTEIEVRDGDTTRLNVSLPERR